MNRNHARYIIALALVAAVVTAGLRAEDLTPATGEGMVDSTDIAAGALAASNIAGGVGGAAGGSARTRSMVYEGVETDTLVMNISPQVTQAGDIWWGNADGEDNRGALYTADSVDKQITFTWFRPEGYAASRDSVTVQLVMQFAGYSATIDTLAFQIASDFAGQDDWTDDEWGFSESRAAMDTVFVDRDHTAAVANVIKVFEFKQAVTPTAGDLLFHFSVDRLGTHALDEYAGTMFIAYGQILNY